ncbi:MAG: 3-phosphoshikimate 1-carboxyvinyltransferase [Prevotella sp.]|nr:3-phosphoshikimate 1-carboxyvinyltransferase [Prevotella sp.]
MPLKTYLITARPLTTTTISLPASKSITNRALILSALSSQKADLENVSRCDDSAVLIAALRDRPDIIDIGAAGSAMRFLTAFLSIREGEHTLTGTARMCRRPIKVLVEALRQLGADITYEGADGFPPLHIRGRNLYGGSIQMEGNVSSQYVSALLMTAPMMRRGLSVQLTGSIISRAYIDLTLGMMQDFGAHAEWTAVDTITVRPQPYKPVHYFIENDWTAASYWYELLALSGSTAELHLDGLTDGSIQGDTTVKYLFSLLGVRTIFATKEKKVPTRVTLRRGSMKVSRLVFDFSNCPDLVQTLVCTCCGLDIPFDFTGLSTLRIKETDRILALKTELRKLGFVLQDYGDSRLVWDGEKTTPADEPINTYEDHRMAMAFAPLAQRFNSLRIANPEVVSKSYPEFWDNLRRTGIIVEENAG